MRSLLIKNKISFELIKNKYYRHYNKYRSKVEEKNELLTELDENGIVCINNFLDTDTIKKINNEISDDEASLVHNKYTGKQPIWRFEDFGVYRLLNIDEVSKTSKIFFEHPTILDIANSYVGKNAKSYQRMFETKAIPGRESSADTLHFDDWKHRFKAFLYLNDVSLKEAPFVYLKKSHHPGPWKKIKEYEYFKYGKKGTYGHYTPYEVLRIKEEYGFKETIYTAKAGTLILVDTRGLHKGSVLLANKRNILANYFETGYE